MVGKNPRFMQVAGIGTRKAFGVRIEQCGLLRGCPREGETVLTPLPYVPAGRYAMGFEGAWRLLSDGLMPSPT